MGIPSLLVQALLFSILKGAVESLRDVHIGVPVAVRLGKPVTLHCEFELERDNRLRFVRWYKSGIKFFMFAPDYTPSKTIFPVSGINQQNLVLDQSNATQLHFREATTSMSGQYTCEISLANPSYREVLVSAHMEVIEPPRNSPLLSGLKRKYRLGEIIHANCTSSGSRPAVNLTWVLNGKSAPSKHVKLFKEVTDNDLIVTVTTIKLHARETHFPNGILRLQCTASLHNIYWQTTEQLAKLDRRKSDNTVRDNGIITIFEDLMPTDLLPFNGQLEPPSSSTNVTAAHVPMKTQVSSAMIYSKRGIPWWIIILTITDLFTIL